MNKILLPLILLIFFYQGSMAQAIYQGPSTGIVPFGVIVSTNTFINNAPDNKLPYYLKRPLRNKIPIKRYSDALNIVPPTAPQGNNYMIDPLANQNLNPDSDPFIIKGFLASLDGNSYIPPDFYCAVGPTHVIGIDNGRFKIFDKSGNLIRQISGDSWFGTTVTGVSAFDPKVLYDHFAKRWIMVWLDENDATQSGNILISVSQDSIPLGTWYNWAVPANKNGSIPTNSWGDYEGVGFDEQAIYITTNQFQFAGNFDGAKIRIIKKSELYANTAGQLSYTDLWDIREPSNPNLSAFTLRPSVFYSSNPGSYYLVCTPPFYPVNTAMVVYKITNSITNPDLTGVDVPMTAYSNPPNANQLGGSNPLIESGGDDLRNEPIFKNGNLWGVHEIRSGSNNAYSSIRYFKINTASNTTVEDVAMGADGFWLYYPAMNVDKDLNLAITYSRSGLTEYIGAFYTTRLNSDPPNYLSGSRILQAGKGPYNKDFGSGRNRWGDYNGIWLDPADQNNFWLLTEYAEYPANVWAGWMSNLRLIPFNGARLNTTKDTLSFATIENGYSSDTVSMSIRNFGSDTLSISNIESINTQFRLLNISAYPLKIGFNQSIDLYFKYYPNIAGNISDSIRIFSNDNSNSIKKIIVKGKGYVINPARYDSIYAISGSVSNGSFVSLNKTSGSSSLIGLSGFSDITGISVKPDDRILYGCIQGADYSTLVRINSLEGDGYFTKILPVRSVRSIAFDSSDVMYCTSFDGKLFRYRLSTNDTTYIGNTNIPSLFNIAINPLNGQMWGVSLANKIFKINKNTGISTQVGIPGFSFTPAIAFNSKGELYGLTGLGQQVSSLVKYDTTTGVATMIGSTNFTGLNSLVFTPGVQPSMAPVSYNLYQNYPNPFNAGTTFEFDIPSTSNINLSVFDLLGRKVALLLNSSFSPGNYKYKWDAPNLPSGIYFYRLQTNNYSAVKKFVIIK